MRETQTPSLDAILQGFNPASEQEGRSSLADSRANVSIRISEQDKERFTRLQEKTRRQFGKTVRKLLLAAMDVAEARAG